MSKIRTFDSFDRALSVLDRGTKATAKMCRFNPNRYRPSLIIGRKTKLVVHTDYRNEVIAITVRYHNTDIVTFKRDGSTMFTYGGWPTVTTLDRLKQLIARFGFNLYSRQGQWYAQRGDTLVLFNAPGIWLQGPKTQLRRKPQPRNQPATLAA